MLRIVILSIMLVLALTAPVDSACNPNAATGLTSRLELTIPDPDACSMISPFLTFADQVDTSGAFIDYNNNFTAKQVFTGGIRIPTGAGLNLCLLSDGDGDGTWGSCNGGGGLGSDPAACSAGLFVTDVATDGTLTCSAVTAGSFPAGAIDETTDLSASLCSNGDYLVKSAGVWTCNGVTVDALTDLSSELCTDGQVLQKTSGAWACASASESGGGGWGSPTTCSGDDVAYGIESSGNALCKLLGFGNISGEVTVTQLPDTFDDCSDCSSSYAPNVHSHAGTDITSSVPEADTLADTTCSNGQILKKTSGTWECTNFLGSGGGGSSGYTNPSICYTLEDVDSGDDNKEFYIANETTEIAYIGCRCKGTCSGTLASFRLEDQAGNAMTGTPTCATTGVSTWTEVTDGNILQAGEGLAFDVTNTPATGDNYTVCVVPVSAPTDPPICHVIPDVNENDDNHEIWMPVVDTVITSVSCHCEGTCTTLATFGFEDRAGNAMTGSPTCSKDTNTAAWTTISAGGALDSGEGLAFDVTNTPTTGDVYTICFTQQVL